MFPSSYGSLFSQNMSAPLVVQDMERLIFEEEMEPCELGRLFRPVFPQNKYARHQLLPQNSVSFPDIYLMVCCWRSIMLKMIDSYELGVFTKSKVVTGRSNETANFHSINCV